MLTPSVFCVSVVPRGPNMEGARMKGLLREGLVVPPKESVRDVFGHMFGYSVCARFPRTLNRE